MQYDQRTEPGVARRVLFRIRGVAPARGHGLTHTYVQDIASMISESANERYDMIEWSLAYLGHVELRKL